MGMETPKHTAKVNAFSRTAPAMRLAFERPEETIEGIWRHTQAPQHWHGQTPDEELVSWLTERGYGTEIWCDKTPQASTRELEQLSDTPGAIPVLLVQCPEISRAVFALKGSQRR